MTPKKTAVVTATLTRSASTLASSSTRVDEQDQPLQGRQGRADRERDRSAARVVGGVAHGVQPVMAGPAALVWTGH